MRKLILIPIILFTIFGCDKDDNAENNEQVTEINIPDDLAVYINVEIPENTTKEEYILLDNKNRELPINTTENIKAEENTIVSLIRKATNKTIYIAYILNDNTSNRMSRNSSTSNTINGVCDNTNVVGVKSTARFILASVLNPISIFHVGNSDKDSFFEIFKSNVLCGTFSDEQILSLENAINQLVEEGKDLTEIAISSAVQTIVEPITGGLFADCWEIGTELILNGQIELDAHPFQDYTNSLILYNSDNPTLPYVIDEFTNVLPNGIIIKDATPLDNGNWKIKFDAYNSLPIPLGVRVGKLQDGTASIIEPANNETNFFIKSNGSSVIQMIQNGVTCEGFVNNAFDSYYTTVTEGLAIRSSDFDKREVELIFNPQNEYVLFQGPNENISVRIYHIMESLSHIFDIIQIGDKLAEVEEENIKIEILNNILSDADILNDVNSNPTNLKVLQQIIGNQMLLYIEESIEDLVSNELTSLLEQYNIEKSAVSKNLTIIKTALDVIDNISYLDAWSKIDNYTVTVKDYKLRIPSEEVGAVTNPSPDNNSTDVPLSGELTFEPGENTPNDVSYKIYFGDTNNPTNFNITNSPNDTYSGTQEGTQYFWKVETISSSGSILATSPIWNFTTILDNEEIVYDYDGNSYETIVIGNQTWLKSNIKTTHYSDGTPIPYTPLFADWSNLNLNDQAYCWYNNDSTNKDIYGALYTYAAAVKNNFTSEVVQGVCPTGWHIPNSSERQELSDYLQNTYGVEFTGGSLKVIGTDFWSSPNINATNETNFSGYPAGIRRTPDDFIGLGDVTHYHINNQSNNVNSSLFGLSYDNGQLFGGSSSATTGRSCRCIKD